MFTLGQFLHCKTGSWSCDSDNADVFAAACGTANTKKGVAVFLGCSNAGALKSVL